MRYQIVDAHTGKNVGSIYSSRIKATRRADKLDLDYGAVRYRVKPLWDDPQ